MKWYFLAFLSAVSVWLATGCGAIDSPALGGQVVAEQGFVTENDGGGEMSKIVSLTASAMIGEGDPKREFWSDESLALSVAVAGPDGPYATTCAWPDGHQEKAVDEIEGGSTRVVFEPRTMNFDLCGQSYFRVECTIESGTETVHTFVPVIINPRPYNIPPFCFQEEKGGKGGWTAGQILDILLSDPDLLAELQFLLQNQDPVPIYEPSNNGKG